MNSLLVTFLNKPKHTLFCIFVGCFPVLQSNSNNAINCYIIHISFWTIDRTLKDTTTLALSRHGSNGNESVLKILQISWTGGAIFKFYNHTADWAVNQLVFVSRLVIYLTKTKVYWHKSYLFTDVILLDKFSIISVVLSALCRMMKFRVSFTWWVWNYRNS